MLIVLVALAASALLGLATGLVFRAWANVVVAPLIAVVSATSLGSHGFGFLEGVIVTVACLFMSQLAYLLGLFLVSGDALTNVLADEVVDDEPDCNREHNIGHDHEQRDVQPSRPPPPET
jgi:hypothetical protein